MIFASERGLRMLSLTSIWHGDGTFYSCSKYFAQLYCIFAHFEAKNKFVDNGVSWVRRTIPAVWVLMRHRRAVDYVEVFYGLDNLPDSNTTSTKSQTTDPFFSNITVNFSPNIVREVREGEWEIRKYIRFPMDPKTGQQYIDSNGQVSCRMCSRKVT